MKFKVKNGDFSKFFDAACKCLPKNGARQALELVRFSVNSGGKLMLDINTGDIYADYIIDGAEIIEKGEFCISGNELVKYFNTLPADAQLEFSLVENGKKLSLKAGKGSKKDSLKKFTFPVDNFSQKTVELPPSPVVCSEKKELVKILTAATSLGSDKSLSQQFKTINFQNLNGELIAYFGSSLFLHRIVLGKTSQNVDVCLPISQVSELKEHLGHVKDDDAVSMYVTDNNIIYKTDTAEIVLSQFAGKYPAVEALFAFPVQELDVDLKELRASFTAALAAFSTFDNVITCVDVKDNLLKVTNTVKGEPFESELDCKGNDVRFSVQAAKMYTGLGFIGENAKFGVSLDAKGNVILINIYSANKKFICVPIREESVNV